MSLDGNVIVFVVDESGNRKDLEPGFLANGSCLATNLPVTSLLDSKQLFIRKEGNQGSKVARIKSAQSMRPSSCFKKKPRKGSVPPLPPRFHQHYSVELITVRDKKTLGMMELKCYEL